jgi:L-malate glycosyltransferase
MQLVLSLSPGGTERLVVDLVTRLDDSFRTVVCCLDDVGAWGAELVENGFTVVPMHRAPGFHPSLGARIARLAQAHGAGIVHCHHYSPYIYGRIASFLDRRLGVMMTEHGRLSDARPGTKRRLANMIFGRHPGRVFAVSEALKQHMVAEGFASDIRVIYNGIDLGRAATPTDRADARRGLGLADDDFVIGTVARLDPVKDLPTLVAAFAGVRALAPRARLVVVGDGPDKAALAAAVDAHRVSDAVQLLGYRADVRSVFPAFDVYVNSSVSEGVSLTILEAMAAGLPVVATGVGGTPEVVVDGSTGVLVPARAPTALADAIGRLYRRPDAGRAMGAAGRARVESCFTIDRMVGDYAREYARLEGRQ